jgi:hypothetical protein
MALRLLPLVTGLLPIVAIHASLLIAINAGAIPACFPYIDGCVSISATGRYEPAVFLFKPAMTTEAALMAIYWLFGAAWLRALSRSAGKRPGAVVTLIPVIGIAGALALIVYVTFLGTQAPFYEFMRRIGIYFYFLFTVVAQIMLATRAFQLSKNLNLTSVMKISSLQLWLSVSPMALGILNVALKSSLDNADTPENVIEWISALVMHCIFVLTYFTWRDTRFSAGWSVGLSRR